MRFATQSLRFLSGAVVVFVAAVVPAVAQQQAVSWKFGSDGNYQQTNAWSLSGIYPDNRLAPPGVTYAAILPSAAGRYTVHLSNVDPYPTVDSMDISNNATLRIEGTDRGLNVLGATTINDGGVLTLNNGHLSGGKLLTNGTGYLTTISGGTLDNVSIDGEVRTDSTLFFTGATAIGPTGKVTLANTYLYVDPGTGLAGTGQLICNGATIRVSGSSPSTLTIGAGLQVISTTLGGGGFSADNVINYTTWTADGFGSGFGVGGTSASTAVFINHGTIDASNSASLTLGGFWSNPDGIVRVNHGALDLQSIPATQAAVGNFNVIGGSTILFDYLTAGLTTGKISWLHSTGSTLLLQTFTKLDNTGAVLNVVDASANLLELDGGQIRGGSVTGGTNSPALAVFDHGSDLLDVDVESDLSLQPNADLLLSGSTQLAAGRVAHIGRNAYLKLQSNVGQPGGLQLAAGSSVHFDAVGGTGYLTSSNGGPLELAAGVDISTAGGDGTIQVGFGPGAQLQNSGSLRAATAGTTLFVYAASVENAGILHASTGTTLRVSGPVTVPTLINSGGRIEADIGGNIDIQGTLSADAPGGVIALTLAGSDATNTSGKVSVRDAAVIGTTRLALSIAPGATPPIGWNTAILTAASIPSPFIAVDGVRISDSIGLAVTYWTTTVTVTAAIPGDANLDRTVDFSDLIVLAQQYGHGAGQTWVTADFTGDGATTFVDLVAVAQHYGNTALVDGIAAGRDAGSNEFISDWELARSMVPEPTSLPMLAVFSSVACRRRPFQAQSLRIVVQHQLPRLPVR